MQSTDTGDVLIESGFPSFDVVDEKERSLPDESEHNLFFRGVADWEQVVATMLLGYTVLSELHA